MTKKELEEIRDIVIWKIMKWEDSKEVYDAGVNNENLYLTTTSLSTYIKENKINKEKFSVMLNRKIAESGETAADICRSVDLNSSTFSKYSSGERTPSKEQLFKIMIGLRIKLNDALNMMDSVGYVYDKSSNVDLIVMAHIANEDYDLVSINHHLINEREKL